MPVTTCGILIGALAVVVAAVCCPTSAVPVDSCGLQTDTAAKRHELSALDRLSGQLKTGRHDIQGGIEIFKIPVTNDKSLLTKNDLERNSVIHVLKGFNIYDFRQNSNLKLLQTKKIPNLTTELNGDVYYVSICHHVPQLSYDSRKLVGAVKHSKEGYSIDLGRIDQSNVFMSDNNIVLTYIGDDGNRNPRDTCKGLRWSTYLTFICDPFSNIDILTLIDEDPNQPEICQIKFEIRTWKTCIRQPISVQNIRYTDQIGSETETSKLNQIPFGNELTNNDGYSKFSTNNNTSSIQFEENNLNQNNSQANSTLNELITSIISNSKSVYENKFKRNENIEKSSNQNGLVHTLPNDKNNHFNSNKKSSNFELDNKYLNQNSEDPLFSNANYSKANIFTNLENKNSNLNQYDSKSNFFNNEHNAIGQNETALNYYKNQENNLNKTNSSKENPEDKPSSDRIKNSDKNKNNESINPNSNHTISEKVISNNEKNNLNKNNSPNENTESKQSSDRVENSNKNKNNESINTNSNQTISKKVTSDNEINNLNNTNSPNENTEGIPFSDSIENLDNSSIKSNSNIDQNSNHTLSEKIVSNNETNSGNENKVPDEENNSTQTNAQNSNENLSNKNVTDIINNKSNNSLQNSTQNDDSENTGKSDSEDTSTLSNRSINDTNKIDSSNEKNHNSSSDSIINTEPIQNYDSSTTSDDQTNQTTNLTTEKIVDGSINNSNTSDLNSTYLNKINSQPDQNTKSPIKGANLSNSNNDDNLTATDSASLSEANSNSGTLFSKLFPNGIQLSAATIFGGLGSLSVISAIVGAAINRYYYKRTGTDQIPFKGTFQCIYVYIKVFLSKICCCCGGNLGTLDFTNEKTPLLHPKMFSPPTVQDEALKQKAKISSDDSKSRKSEDLDSDNSNGENETKTYGSMEYKSDSYNQGMLYHDKEKLFKTEHNLQGKSLKKTIGEKTSALLNVKLIKDIFEKFGKKFEKTNKENTKENVDIPPSGLISQLLEEGKCKITNKNDIAHSDEVIKAKTDESSESHIVQIYKNEKLSSDVEQNEDINVIHDDVDVKSITNFDGAKAIDNIETANSHKDNLKELNENTLETSETELSNQNEIKRSPNDVTKDEIAIGTTINKSQQIDVTSVPEIKTTDEDIDSKWSNLNDLIADLQAFSEKVSENNSRKNTNGTVSEIGINEQNNENDMLDKTQNGNMTSLSEIVNKTKAAKTQFLAADNQKQQAKNKNVEFTDESNVSEKSIMDDDDESTEIIEEVIYVDAAEGEEEGEEIIEETIETTVVETPDANSETLPFSDSHKAPTTTTVRKTTTRKISSTSAPDEITTLEETIVSGYTPEQEKNKFGFQVGIGKSGVNMSVGDKSIGINTSDLNFGKHEEQEDMNKTQDLSLKLNKPGSKFNKKKRKTSTNIKGEEPSTDAYDEISSEKSKKSKTLPNLNIFKRSISQPSNPDIEEANEESLLDVASKKKNRSTSSLFKLGKSKSKSPEKTDVKTDVNASLSSQRTSTVSAVDNLALETGGNEVVAERKISIKTEGGNKRSPKKEKREKYFSVPKM